LHPILIDFGPFSLHTYGLAMAVAFGFGIWIAVKRADQFGVGGKYALDLSVLILIFSLVGARATYVVTHGDEFADHPLDAISPVQHTGQIGIAGLVLLGGVIAGFLTAWVYGRRHRVAFLTTTDIFVPSLALGIAIGRIGCFFNGCCFGQPSNLPWACAFPPESLAGDIYPGIQIHPTQLYESAYMLIIFALFMVMGIAGRRASRPVGVLTGWFLLLYGVGRFFIEMLRWYESEMILIQSPRFTFSQLISLLMVVAGLLLIFRKRRAAISKPEKPVGEATVLPV
jgi:phosphatidylglycerol:prolipoprotein diacylglycerol transferase